MSIRERIGKRNHDRLRKAAAKFAISHGYDLTEAQLDRLTEHAFVEGSRVYGGKIADLIGKLIQDFIDNPEKWIKIIQIIISLF